MKAVLLTATLALVALAMPAQADPGPDVCETEAGDVIETATGSCGGEVEPWQCLGGSGSTRTYDAGGYTFVIHTCSPPPGTIPPVS